jgi:hypothetical protein
MTEQDAERLERLLFAELIFQPDVERHYRKASKARMRELKARLREVIALKAGDSQAAPKVVDGP